MITKALLYVYLVYNVTSIAATPVVISMKERENADGIFFWLSHPDC